MPRNRFTPTIQRKVRKRESIFILYTYGRELPTRSLIPQRDMGMLFVIGILITNDMKSKISFSIFFFPVSFSKKI